MKHWLYRIQPTRPAMLLTGATDEEEALLERHFAYLQGLCDAGAVRLAGRTLLKDERSFGIVIFQAPDRDAALAIMQADPGVQQRLFRAELYPWRTALPRPADD